MRQLFKKREHTLHTIYLLAFFVALSTAIPAYINSTFLTSVATERWVGLIYTLGALLAIISFAAIPSILRKSGNYRTTMLLTLLGIATLAGLAFPASAPFIIALFLIYQVIYRLLSFNTDVLLESFSPDKITGGIRGAYLTANNIAWVIAPIIAGFILGETGYWRVYIVAAFILLISIPIFIKNFKRYKDPIYNRVPFWKTLKTIYRRKNLYKVFAAYLVLRLFFAWMVIYTPIYLHVHIGFPWSTIGIIFTIMLLPYVLLEFPLGKIADSTLGEKEIMSVGFVVLAISSATLAFIASTAIWVWALALFTTRVGASMVEIMGETYFFKKIDGADSDMVSFFRMTGPLSYVIAPLLASILLAFVDFRFLFLALGILMLWGLRYSLSLKDTL
jgi:MFS family permease